MDDTFTITGPLISSVEVTRRYEVYVAGDKPGQFIGVTTDGRLLWGGDWGLKEATTFIVRKLGEVRGQVTDINERFAALEKAR